MESPKTNANSHVFEYFVGNFFRRVSSQANRSYVIQSFRDVLNPGFREYNQPAVTVARGVPFVLREFEQSRDGIYLVIQSDPT